MVRNPSVSAKTFHRRDAKNSKNNSLRSLPPLRSLKPRGRRALPTYLYTFLLLSYSASQRLCGESLSTDGFIASDGRGAVLASNIGHFPHRTIPCRSPSEPAFQVHTQVPLRPLLKQLIFRLLGKDPAAVVVAFSTGDAELCRRITLDTRKLR